MLRTTICDLLGIEHPIIQGGMAHLGTAELVSAVSNAGGLGIIGAGYNDSEWIRDQITCTRELTDKPFGVNIPMISPHVEPVIRVILEEQVAVVTTGAGDPRKYMADLKETGIKVVSVIASVKIAKRMEEEGADSIVAEGTEAGGHIGETTTMTLVPQVVDNVSIPVIAAGGIADGRGLAAALALGACGVQIGTLFACSEECIAHTNYKEKILEAKDRSTVVTGRATGLPMRILRNSFSKQYAALEKAGATAEEQRMFGRGKSHLGIMDGDIDEGSLPAGQIAGLIKKIKPVRVIIEEIMAEAEAIINNLKNQTGSISICQN